MSFWRDLRTNLISGVRSFFRRRMTPQDFVVSFDQLAGLLVVVLAYSALLDWIRAEPDTALQFDAIYGWLLWPVISFLLCALVARSFSKEADTRRVLVVATAMAPWPITILWALQQIPFVAENDDVLTVFTIAVVLSAGISIVRAAYGRLTILALVVLLLGSLLMGRIDHFLYMDTHLWASATADNDESSYKDWDTAESLLFNEPDRIDEAVDSLAAERPGVSDMYYIGFAGDGSQRVFRREALFGQKVFADRMGTGARSLELINDEDDRISYPLGSMSGLHYALRKLGQHMNRDEDVLVLLLTSHGSPDDGLAVQNGSLPLNFIEPDQVRRALDAAGIKWRIVIVSACYAGTFIEPLETENTLVMTASDSQHTSFGCADDRDLTYFGEAFLRDALPKAGSLVEAFQAARKDIRQRERAEKLTPSNPQIFLGKAMRDKLASLGSLPLH